MHLTHTVRLAVSPKDVAFGYFVIKLQIRYSYWQSWIVDPSTNFYVRWLAIVSAAVIYNLVMIIGRAVFVDVQAGSVVYVWMAFDYICDVIYIIDVIMQFRKGTPVYSSMM